MADTPREQSPTSKLERVSPDLLDFDPDNPRFAGELTGKGQDEIQQYLFGEPNYASELVDSLLENGFIDYEPIIAKRRNDRFEVIEGNRRLAAIREIRAHPERYPNRKSDLDSIPVLVFPESDDEQQQSQKMRVYLGIRHLLGFREWPPLSKARFLERESRSEGGLDKIIKEVRLTKQQARRFLIPYRLLSKANLRIPKGDDFWMLAEGLQRTGMKKFLQLEVDPKTLEIVGFNKKNVLLLLNYIYGPPKKPGSDERDTSARVVDDTRALSRLAKVLGSDKATAALQAGKTLDEAEIYVDTREQSLSRLQRITRELALLVTKLLEKDTSKFGGTLLQTLRHFQVAVRAFIKKNA